MNPLLPHTFHTQISGPLVGKQTVPQLSFLKRSFTDTIKDSLVEPRRGALSMDYDYTVQQVCGVWAVWTGVGRFADHYHWMNNISNECAQEWGWGVEERVVDEPSLIVIGVRRCPCPLGIFSHLGFLSYAAPLYCTRIR